MEAIFGYAEDKERLNLLMRDVESTKSEDDKRLEMSDVLRKMDILDDTPRQS